VLGYESQWLIFIITFEDEAPIGYPDYAGSVSWGGRFTHIFDKSQLYAPTIRECSELEKFIAHKIIIDVSWWSSCFAIVSGRTATSLVLYHRSLLLLYTPEWQWDKWLMRCTMYALTTYVLHNVHPLTTPRYHAPLLCLPRGKGGGSQVPAHERKVWPHHTQQWWTQAYPCSLSVWTHQHSQGGWSHASHTI